VCRLRTCAAVNINNVPATFTRNAGPTPSAHPTMLTYPRSRCPHRRTTPLSGFPARIAAHSTNMRIARLSDQSPSPYQGRFAFGSARLWKLLQMTGFAPIHPEFYQDLDAEGLFLTKLPERVQTLCASPFPKQSGSTPLLTTLHKGPFETTAL